MMKHKSVIAMCCVLVLGLSGCSRQQSDWQKTRESNTTEAYEQFLKKYPTGEFTAQAQARVKELYEERDWQKARDADTPEAYQAFLKQYPEGKWTEEARIRVENFTLAQAPGTTAASSGAAETDSGAPTAAANQNSTPVPPPPPPAPTPRPAPSPNIKPAANTGAMSAKATGSYGVQLGAFKSGAGAAHDRWTHLQKEYPAILAGLSSRVVSKNTASGKLYRLQAIGISEKHAREICRSLRAKSQVCVVIPPPHT